MDPRVPEKDYRLTGFEEYMFLDDTPAFPMYSYQTIRFSGTLDAGAIEAAYREAMVRHPLMNALIVQRGSRFYWSFRDEIPPMIRRKRPENDPAEMVPLNITADGGFRLFFDELTDSRGQVTGCELGFQVHHSCSDAMGIFRFQFDMLLIYGAKTGILDQPLPAIAENSLALRHQYGLTVKKYFRNFLPYTFATFDFAWCFPTPLLSVPKKKLVPPADFCPFSNILTFSEEESALFKKAAKRQGLTINDLLLRDLFLATAEFMDAENKKSNPLIRIAVPTNLRTDLHQDMFAANMVSMAFIERRRKKINDSEEFTQSLHRSAAALKKYETGLILQKILKDRRALPGGLQIELAVNRCWSTTVLSNLGRVFEHLPFPRDDSGRSVIGSAVLVEYCATPPLRHQTLTSWGCWTYAGKLNLAVRWDTRYLTPRQQNENIQLFRKYITKSLS